MDQVMSYVSSVEGLMTSALPELHRYTSLAPTDLCTLAIAFNPIFWNIVARTEHATGLGRSIFGAKFGCYLLAVTIFSLGLIRDHIYLTALAYHPPSPTLLGLPHKEIGVLLLVAGNVLVVTSMWALGVTGTYLGDYFGILMDARVTGFPFNVTNNPMYYGSFLSFLGTAFYQAKTIGFWFSAEVLVMYLIALVSLSPHSPQKMLMRHQKFEEPYTAEIYAKRDRERAKDSKRP